MRLTRLAPALVLILAGCRSLEGGAEGSCRVRHGTLGNAPTIAGGERQDPVTVRVTDAGDDRVRIRMNGCELLARETPRQPNTNPHYLVVEGSSCDWDVPGLGRRRFVVANRPVPTDITDGIGFEAYANFADDEIFLVFEAQVEQGQARFDCDLRRTR